MLIQKRSLIQLNPWCRRVVNMLNNADGEARRLLGPHADEFGDIEGRLRVAREEVKRLEAARLAAVEVSEEALRVLSRYCGDARVFAARRILRENLPKLIQKRFGQTGERPKSPTSPKWIQLTADLLDAEVHAVELGHSVLAFPSAAELAEVLATAETAFQSASDADIKHREAALRLRHINDALFKLWRDTSSWFRYSLRDESKPRQRAIMRRFGFEFTSSSDDAPSSEISSREGPDLGGEEPQEDPSSSGGEFTGSETSGFSEPDTGEGSESTRDETSSATNTPSSNEPIAGTAPAPINHAPTGGSGLIDIDASTGTAHRASMESPPIVQDRPSNNRRE